jgi:cystathionine gamma-synthase
MYGRDVERALIFPSYNAARRCRDFIKKFSTLENIQVRIVQLTTIIDESLQVNAEIQAHIAVAFFPDTEFQFAKLYWQHAGEGISSRLAEFCQGRLVKGPPKQGYHSKVSSSPNDNPIVHSNGAQTEKEQAVFVEERFGRNLDLSFAAEAKIVLKRRILGQLKQHCKPETDMLTTDDIYLYPTGMCSIFSAHRALLEARGSYESLCFGFPYVDSLQILKKFGPGVTFFGKGEGDDYIALEKQLAQSKQKFLMLHCEFPSNPLLISPDLKAIRRLADKYDFAVVVDETIGNVANTYVLPYADIVVSSLTKVFSGDCNVMGGSLILNPQGKYYSQLKKALEIQYEDMLWAEDAIYLERNSRDFVVRNDLINENAEAVANLFQESDHIKSVFYPKLASSREFYENMKLETGGYGGLLSVVFNRPDDAVKFFDAVVTAKGPSLGTNFTLTSPYVILAHYGELDYVEQFGIDRNLIRISVGMENKDQLIATFKAGLAVINS